LTTVPRPRAAVPPASPRCASTPAARAPLPALSAAPAGRGGAGQRRQATGRGLGATSTHGAPGRQPLALRPWDAAPPCSLGNTDHAAQNETQELGISPDRPSPASLGVREGRSLDRQHRGPTALLCLRAQANQRCGEAGLPLRLAWSCPPDSGLRGRRGPSVMKSG
jgi:hypothetical protein